MIVDVWLSRCLHLALPVDRGTGTVRTVPGTTGTGTLARYAVYRSTAREYTIYGTVLVLVEYVQYVQIIENAEDEEHSA